MVQRAKRFIIRLFCIFIVALLFYALFFINGHWFGTLKVKGMFGNLKAEEELGITLRQYRESDDARRWLRCADKQGSALAAFSLGEIYYYGEGVPKNYETAFEYFSKSAKLGSLGGTYNLSLMLLRGEGLNSPNPDLAISILKDLSNRGYADASLALGLYYFDSKEDEETRDKALYWLQKNIDSSSSFTRAYFFAGKLYSDRSSKHFNPLKAQEYLVRTRKYILQVNKLPDPYKREDLKEVEKILATLKAVESK